MSSDADNNQLEVRLQSNSYFTGPGRHDLTISDFEPTGTLLIQLICRNAYDGVCRPALTVRFDDGRPTLGLGHPEIPVGSTYVAKLSCVASGCTLQ